MTITKNKTKKFKTKKQVEFQKAKTGKSYNDEIHHNNPLSLPDSLLTVRSSDCYGSTGTLRFYVTFKKSKKIYIQKKVLYEY